MRYGLIGTGYWAAEVHATAIDQAPDAELIGVWGRDPDKAGAVADRFGAQPFDDPAALFEAVDVVAFAVPPYVQAPLAVKAAEAGCHLLLEKPIAIGVDEADALARAVDTHDVASIVYFKLHFIPEVEQWLTQLREGAPWEGGLVWWLGSIFHEGSPFATSEWRKEWGGLWDVGPHALSVLLPVLGDVRRITAARGSKDTAHVVLRHEGGASSTLIMSLQAPKAAVREGIEFYGERGWSAMPDVDPDPVRLLRSAITALHRSIETGEPHPCDVHFAQRIGHILAEAQASLD